jgi:nitroreductase
MKATVGTLTALDVIYSRRSVRAYTAEKIPQTTVRALLDAAVQAPSALGGDALSFVVVQNPRRLEQLSALRKRGGPSWRTQIPIFTWLPRSSLRSTSRMAQIRSSTCSMARRRSS